MSRHTKATIHVHQAISASYYRLVLRAPEAAASALPGQFVMLRVSENMDPLLARPFSIASIISKHSLEIVYRIAGRGTRMLTQCMPGRSLDMVGPLGMGFAMPERGSIPVLITGGSGFPPIHFLSVRMRQHKASPILFVGVKNRACLPPAHIMKNFRKSCASVRVSTEDGSAGTRGLVTGILAPFLEKATVRDHAVLYACGPRAMLMAVSGLAAQHSVPCHVSMEERMACGLGACMGCSVAMKHGGYKRVCKEGPVFNAADIAWSGSDAKKPSSCSPCSGRAGDIVLP